MEGLTIYTTPTCPWCMRPKEYITAKGVSYTEKEVTQNREWIEELQRLSALLAVPVITDGERVVVGFNRSTLDDLIAGRTAE
ncbi:MAG: glutaredoxin family protein [Thermoplasmata archaeon]